VEFLPVPAHIIEDELTGNRGIEPEKAGLLSRLCHGGIGWAIQASLSENIWQERLSRLSELEELENTSLDKRFDYAAGLAAKYSKNRESVEEILKLWIGWWRDLLLIKAGCAELITNKDREATLNDHSRQYSLTGIRNFIESIQAAIIQLEQNANARLVFEVLILNIPVKEEERSKQPSA
jgi:DNA polymerase-3 subunit delta'